MGGREQVEGNHGAGAFKHIQLGVKLRSGPIRQMDGAAGIVILPLGDFAADIDSPTDSDAVIGDIPALQTEKLPGA